MVGISLVYDGTIPFQYLKTVVAMQDSTLSETANLFLVDESHLCERGGMAKQRHMHLFCAA